MTEGKTSAPEAGPLQQTAVVVATFTGTMASPCSRRSPWVRSGLSSSRTSGRRAPRCSRQRWWASPTGRSGTSRPRRPRGRGGPLDALVWGVEATGAWSLWVIALGLGCERPGLECRGDDARRRRGGQPKPGRVRLRRGSPRVLRRVRDRPHAVRSGGGRRRGLRDRLSARRRQFTIAAAVVLARTRPKPHPSLRGFEGAR